jgi:hypothetical protein
MRNTIAARSAKKMQAVRNWTAFAVPNGQIVYRGRYYFAWSRGHFVGAYDSLDDAVESLTFRNGARATDPAEKLRLQSYGPELNN